MAFDFMATSEECWRHPFHGQIRPQPDRPGCGQAKKTIRALESAEELLQALTDGPAELRFAIDVTLALGLDGEVEVRARAHGVFVEREPTDLRLALGMRDCGMHVGRQLRIVREVDYAGAGVPDFCASA